MNENNNNDNKDEITPSAEQYEKLAIAGEKTALSSQTIIDFTIWVTANIESIDIQECTSIYEDFLKSNEHIIQRINKVKS
jgi:hypothetical protein